jgi:hypothetical protein
MCAHNLDSSELLTQIIFCCMSVSVKMKSLKGSALHLDTQQFTSISTGAASSPRIMRSEAKKKLMRAQGESRLASDELLLWRIG